MEPSTPEDRSRREWLAVAALTAIGFGLRSWPVGRLGLTHFDEGIYAMSADWSLSPKGLAGIDPMLISYAPPGYPILGGVAYWLLGRSDGAMIVVSQIVGSLTIPVVAWLARRTFGPGAGFAAATFCAFSGPHIAFSRMALTDASFLLAWLLAIGAGMRFLERPGVARAIVLGLAVGLAQEFKYNGWLAGGIVVASALWGILSQSEERGAGAIARTLGWGILAAGVAWLVVWPWYAFVEAHGGYSALLRHQRSYLGGFRDWEPNFLTQADQALALSGGFPIVELVVAFFTPWIARPRGRVMDQERRSGLKPPWTFYAAMIPWGPFGVFSLAPYWLGLIAAPWMLGWPRPSGRLVGVCWLVLTVMTPFYHPYARLWLPYHACNWFLMGWVVARIFGPMLATRPGPSTNISPSGFRGSRHPLLIAGLICLGLIPFAMTVSRQAGPKPGLLDPSDSLYRATLHVSEILPKDVQGLRLLVRPPITFYLSGRVALYPMAGSDQLLKGGDPRFWVLVDSAILRSEPGGTAGWSGSNLPDRFAKNWEIVEEIPTIPSLPTLLDLDPDASRSGLIERAYPLWLLRPRTSKARR